MKVGMSIFMQNTNDKWTDYEVYHNDLALADQAESLGFDSIWSVEHHFTPYTMVPDVLQFLTYMAGRTSKIELGSMVVVLPWHDPVRVAEQIAMLDNLSKGSHCDWLWPRCRHGGVQRLSRLHGRVTRAFRRSSRSRA